MKLASKPLLISHVSVALLMPVLWSQPRTRLSLETLEGFERYVANVEREHEIGSTKKGEPLFWIDRLQASVLQDIKQGKIFTEQIEDVPEIPKGIIHDWVGAVFIPHVRAADVVGLLTDYNRHKEIYPEVIDSKTLEKTEDYVRGYLLLNKTRFLTVVLDTEHRAQVLQIDEHRWGIVSRSTKIAEVKNFGSSDQKELPVGSDSGFLWRINAYWGILEEEDGVMVECTTISLSRDIPWGLGWIIGPIVEDMPRETLEGTLHATQSALTAVKALSD